MIVFCKLIILFCNAFADVRVRVCLSSLNVKVVTLSLFAFTENPSMVFKTLEQVTSRRADKSNSDEEGKLFFILLVLKVKENLRFTNA